MISIANPIYDSVFKYLMEDMCIARTILSALLKKEIVEVDMRRHEYTNVKRDDITMFRIDFGAKVRQDDGSVKLILIELQKKWVETETLRFRQYIGSQYTDPANLVRNTENRRYGLPMVTVYLLGHRLGDIDEPVLYVNHKAYDYYGREVTKGLPDSFVESLVHDSIIVQIPLLKGRVGNRLEHVLSIFDQSNIDSKSRQIMNVDENGYADDDMRLVLHRLVMAASDSKIRQDMNVEDEFFSAIDDLDMAIMMRDTKIAQQDSMIAQQDSMIAQQDSMIAQQDSMIAQQDSKIAQQDSKIAQQDSKIAQQDSMIAQQNSKIAQQDSKIAQQDSKIAQQDSKISQQDSKIAQQDRALIESARALKKAGLQDCRITEITGLQLDVIRQLF